MITPARRIRARSNAHEPLRSAKRDMERASAVETLSSALRQVMWHERLWLKTVLAEYDLDISPWMILVQLKKHDGVCSMGELAQALEQPNATTTGHVDRLVEKDLVTRQDGAGHDRRKVNVRLTEQGMKLCLQIVQARLLTLSRAAAGFSEPELQNATNLVQAYVQEMEQQIRQQSL